MTNLVSDRFDRHTGCRHQRDCGVSQLIRRPLAESRCIGDPMKRATEVGRVERCPDLGSEYEIPFRPGGPSRQPLVTLLLTPSAQHGSRQLWYLERPARPSGLRLSELELAGVVFDRAMDPKDGALPYPKICEQQGLAHVSLFRRPCALWR